MDDSTTAVSEEARRQIEREMAAVANMRVFKRRLPSDDGYEFRAATKRPGKDWRVATHADLITLACRALLF